MIDGPDTDGGDSSQLRERNFSRDNDPAAQGFGGAVAFYVVFGICVLISIFIRVV